MKWEEKLARELGLKETDQDFGICNADGKRLSEFIDYFRGNQAVDPWEWEELLDLILESANEAILGGYVTTTELEQIGQILRDQNELFPIQLEYWSNFPNSEGTYPIVDFVNSTIRGTGA